MSNEITDVQPTEAELAKMDKQVSAAYLLLIGSTQEEAATAVGVCEKTIRNWKNTDEWPDIVQAARDRWLTGLAGLARNTLNEALKETANGKLALDVIERLDPALLPARMRIEVTDLPPIEFVITDGD